VSDDLHVLETEGVDEVDRVGAVLVEIESGFVPPWIRADVQP
jgi:hypothetical protein